MEATGKVFECSNLECGRNLASVASARLVGHEGPIRAVKFTADGKYCLTAGHDRTVRLWNPMRRDPAQSVSFNHEMTNLSNKREISSLPHALPIQSYEDGHNYPVSAIDIDYSSTTLVSASDKNVIVTDVITRKMKRRFQGHTGRVNSVSCSKDGSVIISASYDGSVRIWDGRSFSSTPIQVLSDAKDSVSCVKIINDDVSGSKEIVTTSIDGKMRTYDLRRGVMSEDDFGEHMSLTNIAFTSDARCSVISCLDGAIHITERSSGSLLNTMYGGHKANRYSIQCAVSPDDNSIISGSEDGSVVLYDFMSKKVVQRLIGHVRATCSVSCHPSLDHSSVILSGSYDGEAIVWSNGSYDNSLLD